MTSIPHQRLGLSLRLSDKMGATLVSSSKMDGVETWRLGHVSRGSPTILQHTISKSSTRIRGPIPPPLGHTFNCYDRKQRGSRSPPHTHSGIRIVPVITMYSYPGVLIFLVLEYINVTDNDTFMIPLIYSGMFF